MREWWSKVTRFAQRRRGLDTELREEMQAHLDLLTVENRERGMTAEQAQQAARRRFGNTTLTRELAREAWQFPAFDSVLQDLRSGLRAIRKSPGFSLVVILTLALGMGANTAIFSVINAILLKPYPWPGSERLVYANNSYPVMGLIDAGVSIPDYLDRHDGVTSFEDSALFSYQSLNLDGDGRPERLSALGVTPSLFTTLQSPAALGSRPGPPTPSRPSTAPMPSAGTSTRA